MPRTFRLLTLALAMAGALSAAPRAVFPDKPLKVQFGPKVEIGRDGGIFASVTSVCEDADGNILALDARDFVVRLFRPDGAPAGAFGRKGEGPGDFRSPGRVTLLPGGEIAVLEDISYITIFDRGGKYLRRLDLNGRLDLGWVGPDRFYTWSWTPESQQQALVDAKGRLVRELGRRARDAFSTSLPDETGRLVMFSYFPDEYVPEFLFDSCAGTAAVGTGDRYEVRLLDENGVEKGVARRDVPPLAIGPRDRAILETRVREFTASRRWPPSVAKALAAKIPAARVAVKAVRVSPELLFVVRPSADLSKPDAAAPADVFTLKGEYLGTATLPGIPVAVSAKAMYFVRSDDAGNEYLERLPYSVPTIN